MNTQLSILGKQLRLYRYPKEQQHKSLQAWDAADELLINHIHEAGIPGPFLLLNDEFGALRCFFEDAIHQSYTDSRVSYHSILQNWKENHQELESPAIQTDLSSVAFAGQMALMKLPKSNDFLVEMLIHLRQILPDGAQLITAGKANAIQKSTLALFEKHLGPTKTSLAKKKSRLIFTTVDKFLATVSKYPKKWPVANSQLMITNLANSFANDKLDIGARFLLDHLPIVKNKSVIDLGCGNGVLSAHIVTNSPREIHLVDESFMAIQAAKETMADTCEQKGNSQNMQLHYHHSNCLDNVELSNIDVVVCNPPFHQNNTITDHIAWQMFVDSRRVLRPGGELRIVGNRHLGYHDKLKRLFGGYKVIASNNKFVILSSIKKA